jgi:amphi-Trp domain-containing protein
MASKRKVAYADTVSPSTAAEYLESLAKGLRERAVLVESGASSVTLDVPGDVRITIDVSEDADKGRSGIEIGMGWRKREPALNAAPGLLIVPGAAALESTLDDI